MDDTSKGQTKKPQQAAATKASAPAAKPQQAAATKASTLGQAPQQAAATKASAPEQAPQQESAISALLDTISCELIGLCLDTIAEGGEVKAMLLFATATQDSSCFTFDEDTTEECINAARDYVVSLKDEITAYALAYDGFVQLDDSGATQDALIVEFGERGASTAYSAYVSYHKGKSEKDFFVGEPLPAGEETLLLQ